MGSSSILFQNASKTVVLLDLPRSLEEAQVPSHRLTNADPPNLKRLVSAVPPTTPFNTPEPKSGFAVSTSSPASQVAGLMTLAAAEAALAEIQNSHTGPWCLPRIYSRGPSPPPATDNNINTDPSPFLIPEDSHYLHGTISAQRETFLSSAFPSFNLILLDPPWPNRSAKRKRGGYHPVRDFESIRDLLSLIPVASHLAVDGLVGVWVTNSPQSADLLTAPQGGLFAQWDVELVGEWVWLKVTTEGEPIVSLDSAWRKPWERLLIGRKRGGKGGRSLPGTVIVTVPDVHSRKPNLRRLFEEDGLVPTGYRALEVFARNLTAGWWSLGDEVLLFQHRDHWAEPTSEDTTPEHNGSTPVDTSSATAEPAL
ncbi:MT-A70 family [Cercophora newfieldiana]|uniref:MT-A70 family n=1 Tax=Cercophora newfieldiana TaxID=92897 RepID=A0AA40CM54_9PEZI|nr:MT-A70 family [Cercophora newfieldiana]